MHQTENSMKLIELWSLPPGTVLRVSHGLYDHVGLLSDRWIDGERAVVSFSARNGGLIEEAFSQFASGRGVAAKGYPGQLPPLAVLARARALKGRAYAWLTFNCEHFIRNAHGLPEESPQLRQWLFAATLVGLFARAAAG
jgi:hypothetical protein